MIFNFKFLGIPMVSKVHAYFKPLYALNTQKQCKNLES